MSRITFIDNCLHGGNGIAKYRRFFDYSHMPKINGHIIDSIWSPYDFVSDESEWDDPLLYDKWTYSPYFSSDREDSTLYNVIDKEIRKLFGWQTIAGKLQFVRHISFRTSSSGHANPDNIATIYVSENIISVYDIEGATYYGSHSIYYNDPYFVKVCETLLNKKFTVEHYNKPNPGIQDLKKQMTLKEAHFYKEISCGIRFIDGLIYPDALLSSWRNSNLPVIANKYCDKSIRVWYEPWNSHLFLRKITLEEFPDFYGNVFFVDFHYRSQSCSNHGFVSVRQKNDGSIIMTEVNDTNRNDILKEISCMGKSGMYQIVKTMKSHQNN